MPPIGGRNTSRSPRVTSSGNMPPVCSNSVRRRSASAQPKRVATPGRYQTGSMRGLDDDDVAARLAAPCRRPAAGPRAIASAQLGQADVRLGDGDGRLDVVALLEVGAEGVADDRAERIERDDLLRIGPRGKRPDRVRRRGVGQIRLAQRIERAGRHRERAVDRVRAGVRPDHVAVRAVGDGRRSAARAPSGRARPRRSGPAWARGRPGAR